MTDFLQQVADDLRHGRETWRVLTISAVVSFAIAVVVTTVVT